MMAYFSFLSPTLCPHAPTFLSFVLLNMLDSMLQNLYKRNAFIVLGIPLLLGIIAVITQFLRNEKLKTLNTDEL